MYEWFATLRRLRNTAAHAQDRTISPAEAYDYVDQAEEFVLLLKAYTTELVERERLRLERMKRHAEHEPPQ